jgi:Xaa-Pro aminopeptidase
MSPCADSAPHARGRVAARFLAPSDDLEYLTGSERQIPDFGQASYAHGWVTGAFPLEADMTFTDEPSLFIPDRVGLRIEDIIVCEEGGGRMLNSYSRNLVVSA